MIECLSNADWLAPQIDFLLHLQNIRIAHFEMFNKLFLSITILGEHWLPTLVCAIIYWCFDSKIGMYLFSLNSLNTIFVQVFKMAACVYRPWVLSDKIHPVPDAVTYAKGYSFPSGHSAMSSSVLGGLAFSFRNRKMLAIGLVLLVLLVGFSRMWLGVHTPQDVVVGLAIGFSLVFVMHFLLNWAEKNKNRYLYILFIMNLIIIGFLAYICYFVKYPVDYLDGKLLVNPERSIAAAVLCYGYAAGIFNGCLLCRRFFPFDAKEGGIKSRVIRGIIGSLFIVILLKTVVLYLFVHTCDYKIAFSLVFIIGFFITGIYPYIFSHIKLNSSSVK